MTVNASSGVDEGDIFNLDVEHAAWFELLTGIRLLLERPRHCCPKWIIHGTTCAWNHGCRQLDTTFDHPVQAMDAAGNRAVLLAPYRLRAGREATDLSVWCSTRSLAWETVPVAFWGTTTTTVIVRHVEAIEQPWRHFVASDLATLREHFVRHGGPR